jgi:hypothetical protein
LEVEFVKKYCTEAGVDVDWLKYCLDWEGEKEYPISIENWQNRFQPEPLCIKKEYKLKEEYVISKEDAKELKEWCNDNSD